MEIFDPQPGDMVCNCRFKHLKVKSREGDDVILEDGFSYSVSSCLDPADHPEPHPEGY
jgi:hypothetical protein